LIFTIVSVVILSGIAIWMAVTEEIQYRHRRKMRQDFDHLLGFLDAERNGNEKV
jgi:hypothetical protein